MRIAIDATAIPEGSKKGGVACYILNLINGLVQIDQSNVYYIFIKKEDLSITKSISNNFHFILCKNIRLKLIRLIWEQTMLPFYIKRYKIDVLHSPHYTVPFNLNCCGKVVTFHDMTFFLLPEMHIFYKRLIFRKIISISAKKANAIICVSKSTAKDVEKILDIEFDKVTNIPLGVSSKYKIIKDEGLISNIKKKYNTSDKFIFYLGTLEPRKNIDKLIKAYKLSIISKQIEHKLVIGGEKGWDYKKLFQLVSDLKLNDRIVFTGFIPANELPVLYNVAELFVYPSIYEGFGIPVLEAMACGAPVVSSNVSSLPEIIKDSGLLVDPNNVEELSSAICNIIANIELSEKLKRLGILRAKHFSWQRAARETLKVYENVYRNKSCRQ